MHRTANRHSIPSFDALEGRRLSAADVTASLNHGVLTVTGLDPANVIIVSIVGSARGNRGGVVQVYGLHQAFPATRVKAIEIVGGPGSDAIAVLKSGRPAIPVRIDGGGGNDLINGVWSGQAGAPGGTTSTGVTPYPRSTFMLTPTPSPTPTPTPSPIAASTSTLFPGTSMSPAPAPVIPPPSASPLGQTEQQIVDLTNAWRVQAGLPPLSVSPQLNQVARIESDQMVQAGQMSHNLPGTADPEPQDRAAAAVGYRFLALGENIAFNYPDADAVVAGWMASAGHRANILGASYTQIGVAVAYDPAGRPYYTQEFGEPA